MEQDRQDQERQDHESVDRLVEAILTGDEPDGALAAAAGRVRALASAPIPPEVRARHLAVIRGHVEEAPRRAAGLAALRRRLTALAAGLATFLTLGGGAVAMAQNAEPGDVLYGLKRATERVRLALAGDDEGSLRVGLAERRIAEAARAGDQRDELLEDALEGLLAAPESEHAVAVLASLLEAGLPDEAADRARDALAAACERIAERTGGDAPAACRSVDAPTTLTDETADGDGDAGRGTRGGTPADPEQRPSERAPDRDGPPARGVDDREQEPDGPPATPGGRAGDLRQGGASDR